MKMTAADQQELGVIDIVVPEPGEGAHTDPPRRRAACEPIIVDRLDRARGAHDRRAGRGALPALPGAGVLH